jgi:hypothetical protein
MRYRFPGSVVLTSIAIFVFILICKCSNSNALALDTGSNDSLKDLIRQEIRNLVAPNIPQVYTGEFQDPPLDWTNVKERNATLAMSSILGDTEQAVFQTLTMWLNEKQALFF